MVNLRFPSVCKLLPQLLFQMAIFEEFMAFVTQFLKVFDECCSSLLVLITQNHMLLLSFLETWPTLFDFCDSLSVSIPHLCPQPSQCLALPLLPLPFSLFVPLLYFLLCVIYIKFSFPLSTHNSSLNSSCIFVVCNIKIRPESLLVLMGELQSHQNHE